MIQKKLALLTLFFGMTLTDLFANDLLLKPDSQASATLILPIFMIGIGLIIFSKLRSTRSVHKDVGFLSITPHRPRRFFSLNEAVVNMEPVVEALAGEHTNVYSNLSKLTLAVKPNGVFLEDKNYKISVLINRRRSRRCFLNDGDIIDMGELTLMFRSPLQKDTGANYKKQTSSNHPIPRGRRTHAKLLKNCPALIPVDPRKKTFYLTKNTTSIGRSEMNDLIPKSKSVSLTHSRIDKIGGRYKLVDLNSQNGTFVNGRRVDSKYLREKDEVSFESIKYVFSTTGTKK